MKIINLMKCEFIKNYTLKKILGVLLILLFAVIIVTEFQEYYYADGNPAVNELNHFKREYQNVLEYSSEDVHYQAYQEYILPKTIAAYEKLLTLEDYESFCYSSWQVELTRKKVTIEKQLYFIDKYLNNEYVSLEWLEYDEALGPVKELSLLSEEELLIKKQKLLSNLKKYDELITENKFYKYIANEINEYKTNDEFYYSWRINEYNVDMMQTIVDKKLESERHYYVLNIYSLIGFGSTGYDSEYVSNISKKERVKYQSILKYSIEHDMKHDLTTNGIIDMNREYSYRTSKSAVNLIFSLSIVVMFLVIITSGDIVSREHILGTEKMLMTSPTKRWKILLSKFIYMILNMYIIWFIALILLSIYAGIKYGFNDLFTPKLIYFNGNVMEINYYLYTIIKILYISIPVISLISIILMLSTITLNTTMTVGSTMAVTIISPFLWHFIQQFRLALLAYTPIPYFMFSQIVGLNENYLKTVEFTKISEGYGIFISIVTAIICYLISHIIYTRRDVKN